MHLLKSGAKATATDRKRKKIELKGTFGQYQEQKGKHKAESYELNIPGVVQQKKPAGNAKQIKEQKMNE